MTGYYSFDEGQGPRIFDRLGKSGSGVLKGGIQWGNPTTAPPTLFTTTSPSVKFKSYVWSTGANTPNIQVTSEGTYSVNLVDSGI